jgi:hypothetical protein
VEHLIKRELPCNLYYPQDFVVIDDWRFKNEREYIEREPLYDVVTFKMERKVYNLNSHESECSLPKDDSYYHGIIYNTGDIISLHYSAQATAGYILDKFNKGVK